MIGVKGKMPQIGAFMVKKMREKSETTSAFFYGTMVATISGERLPRLPLVTRDGGVLE
jgi:hypothetical protein